MLKKLRFSETLNPTRLSRGPEVQGPKGPGVQGSNDIRAIQGHANYDIFDIGAIQGHANYDIFDIRAIHGHANYDIFNIRGIQGHIKGPRVQGSKGAAR